MKTSAKELTKDKINKIKKEVVEMLSISRHHLLLKYPFWGNIAMRLEIVPVRDKRVRTMCTDGKKIYADCDFTSKLTSAQKLFVLAHEIGHNVMMHLTRKMNRDADLFNIATDKEINYILKEDGFDAPKNLLWPEGEEIGKSAEEIYELLLKKRLEAAKNNFNSSNDSLSSEAESNRSSDEDNANNGKKSSSFSGQFDNHQYQGEEDCDKTANSEKVEDQWGEVGYDDDFNPCVDKDFADRIKEIIIAEAQKIERMQGHIPAGISSLVNKILKPEIKWQEVLARFITKCYHGNRTWLPPNRRYVYRNVYRQSQRSEKIRVAVGIDTSGSCEGDLPKFLSELIGLVNSFGQYELHMIQCDAKVDKYDYYDDCNPLEVSSYGFEFKGGGGTDARPIFDYINDNSIDVDCVVIFTDGYTTAPERNFLGKSTLWVLTTDGNDNFCDWGEKLRFKTEYARSYSR